ncbi:unnamed protein product [Caenorhabditis auriculariae]|uniref:Uncharacterized protein n=1 Tax=Caenorhabditis auriculariae TaxID=2777116 RepID=A0A8S1GXX3_9PELO|nr:unnamed protein product [Caenorhabditis auriculariae]
MGAQTLSFIDYGAVLIVGLMMAVILFTLSVCFNFWLIREDDDVTVFEKMAARRGIRMGPHRISHVQNALRRFPEQSRKIVLEL